MMFVEAGFARVMGGQGGNAPAGMQYALLGGPWSSWTPATGPFRHHFFVDDGRRLFVITGGCGGSVVWKIYDKALNTWLADDAPSSPAGMSGSAVPVWIGSEIVAWGGDCPGPTYPTIGGRYQPPATR